MVKAIKALVVCAAVGAGAGAFFISAARADDYADVTGLVYIRIHSASVFEPAENVTVKLYKRTDTTLSRWLSYGAETADEN